MLRIPVPFLLTLLFVVGALGAQSPDRKTGDIFRGEIDKLVDLLRDTSRLDQAQPAAPAVLGSDALSTAKILAAMGWCHRRYHIGDGPVVRPSLDYLMQQRRADGSFGDDATTTAWTIAALERMDDKGYAEECAAASRWLTRDGHEVSSFAGAVAAVLDGVQADRFPEHAGADAAKRARTLIEAGANVDRRAAADVLVTLVSCQEANRTLDKSVAEASRTVTWSPQQENAFQWLWQQQQDGVFAAGGQPSAALTGFGLMALQTKPRSQRTAEQQEAIVRGLRWLVGKQDDTGNFSEEEVNYTTCVVVGALSRWDDPIVAPVLQKAQRAILGFQNIEAAGYQSRDRDYGSVGYGGSQRGDLSNTHFALEALRLSGLPEDHEALQKAIVFLQRTQNLKAVNDLTTKIPDPERPDKVVEAVSGDDGGAAYYPGNSAAGYLVRPDGKVVARSYGSMTYALLKAYSLAGVKADDARMQAAVKWIQDNWTLAANPGADPTLGEKVRFQGLFYYFMVLAQALDLCGIDKVTVRSGSGDTGKVEAVDWRQALRAQLAGMQASDGSWVNGENGRWMESVPLLCTCYAMVALERCK